MSRKIPLEIRFWRHVDKDGPNGCWLWTGATWKGYGKIGAPIWSDAPLQAHRVSYELANGPIPNGLFACHTCDVRACVNPAHLFLGTAKDNLHDCISKGRFRSGRLSGEAHGSTKITAATALAIKTAAGKYRDIAAEFDVSFGHVWKIKTGKLWKELSA